MNSGTIPTSQAEDLEAELSSSDQHDTMAQGPPPANTAVDANDAAHAFKSEQVVSLQDTDIDDDVDSEEELGTPLGMGAPAGFGEFDDEEYSSHRFLGPSVAEDEMSARALHGLRRLMVHAKPPRFVSEVSSMRSSFSRRRTSSTISIDDVVDQPLNTYQVTFGERQSTGFATRLSLTGTNDGAELALRIERVTKDSTAFKAGVLVGDTLWSINDHPIEPHMTDSQVQELLAQRGTRTVVFMRPSIPRSNSSTTQPQAKVSRGSSGAESYAKKPTRRFTKTALTSAFSYGSSLMAAKLKRRKPTVHKGIMCDGCGIDPVTGALWTCSVCPNHNLCTDCYHGGMHGMENTDAMQALNEALVQYKLEKQCKRFTPEFLLSLRRDICKGRPDKFQYMGGWIAGIVNGVSPSKITVRGIEIPHLPPTSRQRFVGKLMPLVSNRTDIEVNIEWLPDDSGRPSDEEEFDDASHENLEKLRIWISDKKTRTTSPFASS